MKKNRRHKTLNGWACQIVRIVAKWIGKIKYITIAADSAFATYILAHTCIDIGMSLVSRMKLDARTVEFPTKEKNESIPVQECSWYMKDEPTFSDVIKYLRLEILKTKYFSKIGRKVDLEKNTLFELISLLAAA